MSHPKTSNRAYTAPTGRLVRVVTILVSLVLLGVFCLGLFVLPVEKSGARAIMMAMAPLILGGAALFGVRGYELRMETLIVRRPLWEVRIPLRGLAEVELDPAAAHGSIRLFGNGGLFAFTGWYRNRKLGIYRAFVTDFHRCVILRFADRRVVVSPDRPEDFAAEIKAMARLK